jgi:integrase
MTTERKKTRRANGEGSITQRKDGRWQGYVITGYDPENNQVKKQYFYAKSKKELADKMRAVQGQVSTGAYQEPSKLRVADWFNLWINEYQKQSLRPTTWESYKMQLDKHILPAIGHLHLTQLQTYHLQTLYNDKQKDGARLDGKPGPLSPRSVRYIHMICHAALEQAKKEGKLLINPADAVKLPHDPRKEIKFLDTDQVKTFLSAARETKHFAAYFMALNTGLRRGELLGLRWKDVDLKEGSITVNQGLVRTKEGLSFQEPKTRLSNRTIGISKEVVNELKFHRRRQMADQERIPAALYEDHGLVFCSEDGRPMCPRGFTRHFERIFDRINRDIERKGEELEWPAEVTEAAKIKKVPFHALRHTFATLCLQQGTDARTIQEALGHHKASFTLDVYSGVTKQMKQEATSKIGSLLASCLGN